MKVNLGLYETNNKDLVLILWRTGYTESPWHGLFLTKPKPKKMKSIYANGSFTTKNIIETSWGRGGKFYEDSSHNLNKCIFTIKISFYDGEEEIGSWLSEINHIILSLDNQEVKFLISEKFRKMNKLSKEFEPIEDVDKAFLFLKYGHLL